MLWSFICTFVLLSAAPSWCQRQTEGERLQALLNTFWNWRLEDAPLFATAIGNTQYNDDLELYTERVYTNRKAKVAQVLRSLKGIRREQLDTDDQLNYDIFTDYLQTYLDGARYNHYFALNSVNFLEGVTADPGRLQTLTPLTSEGHFKDYLGRLTKLPRQIHQQIELLKVAVSSGSVLNNVSVLAVPGQIDSVVSGGIEQSAFYQPAFTTKLNALPCPQAQRESFRQQARNAVGKINEALGRLKTYLQNTYLPATSRRGWGLGHVRGGAAMYSQCLRYHTSTNMTPRQVHDKGLREVARIRARMTATLKLLNFTGTIKEFYDSLREDPAFHKNSSQEMLDYYKELIFNIAFPKVRTVFRDIPDLPLRVQALSFDGPSGMYLAGTPDGSVPGIFYANVMHPEDEVTIGMMALILHEAVPGHHLQAVYSLNSTLPPYRRFVEDANYYRMPATFPINTAYLEGWALYAEYLGEELGLYTDHYMLMGRYSEEIFRACRLVVDTGLHYMGWDREEAIQYFLDNTALARSDATTEVDRYLTWPGQATAYKIGELKIRELRQKASDALGRNFQLADFHGVVLKNGGMSLSLLERVVDRWVAKVKDVTSSSPTIVVPGRPPLVLKRGL